VALIRAARVSKPEWPFGAPEVMKIRAGRATLSVGVVADEVDSALELLSPTASLIRDARLNQ